MEFHQFTRLPLELQTQIWEEYTPSGPAMHVFDVCFPSWKGEDRAEQAFKESEAKREVTDQYKKQVFLDRFESEHGAFDPSMYRVTTSSRLISRVAYEITRNIEAKQETNTIHLPGRAQKITIPTSDVLMLRFREHPVDHTQLATETLNCPPPIGELLQSQWSGEMASALQRAKRIAIDVTETWATGLYGEMGFEEITFFASTIQKGLEVLYLVDDCAGRCKGCEREDAKAEGLQRRDQLWKDLNEDDETRPGDIIRAVSRRYVEVFDLEGLGWAEHPSYMFARIISAAIRSQQRDEDKGKFQGVRVLVVEDE
ncbi:2EXR domain-containing protein [Fusarium sp. LHS14.1]|nr:2EXR domain-containing protein [Fusarium sp. LHS14.1]